MRLCSPIFHRSASRRRVASLREALGDSLVVGGTGWNLRTRLTAGAKRMFPDYKRYWLTNNISY